MALEKNTIETHLAKKEPWLPMKDEPEDWYSKFIIFRDLGTRRTISETVRQATKRKFPTPKELENYSKKSKEFYWKDRAHAYDVHIQKMRDEERDKTIREIMSNQYRMVEVLTAKTLQRIESMSPDELEDAQDIIKAFDTAIKTGSLVIGLPTERTESSSVKFTINMNEKNLGDDKIIDVE